MDKTRRSYRWVLVVVLLATVSLLGSGAYQFLCPIKINSMTPHSSISTNNNNNSSSSSSTIITEISGIETHVTLDGGQIILNKRTENSTSIGLSPAFNGFGDVTSSTSSSSSLKTSYQFTSDTFTSSTTTPTTTTSSSTESSFKSESKISNSAQPSFTYSSSQQTSSTEGEQTSVTSERETSYRDETTSSTKSSSLTSTPSTTSEKDPVSTKIQNGSTIIVTRTSVVSNSPTASSSNSNDTNKESSGLSQTNKIVVGVVVGVGGAILLGITGLFFYLKSRKNDRYESGKWTFWRKEEKVGSDEFLSGELGVRDRNINQGSNF